MGNLKEVQWVGNTSPWPDSGSIMSSSELWINTESWPMGAAVGERVVYSTDHGATWRSADMSRNGTVGNNDKWHVNLGTFPCGTTLRYAVEITDLPRWDNNAGQDYRATVKTADGEICCDSLPNLTQLDLYSLACSSQHRPPDQRWWARSTGKLRPAFDHRRPGL